MNVKVKRRELEETLDKLEAWLACIDIQIKMRKQETESSDETEFALNEIKRLEVKKQNICEQIKILVIKVNDLLNAI